MAERVVACFFLLLSISYLYFAQELSFGSLVSPKAGFLPHLIGIISTILALAVASRHVSQPKANEQDDVKWTNFIFIGIGLIIYVIILNVVGYLIASFVIMLYLLKITDTQGWLVSIALSAGSALGFYIVFGKYLGVYLP